MSIDRTRDTLAARKAGQPKTTGSLQPIPGRCGCKLTFTGTSPDNPPRYCMRWPTKGRTRCKGVGHGGGNPIGFGNPRWIDGRHSRLLPDRMVTDYEALLKDDKIQSLREEIALQRTFYRDLMARSLDGAVVAPRLLAAVHGLFNSVGCCERGSVDSLSAACRASGDR